jgi:transcriptional regulator LmrA/YxaF-like protein
MRTHFAEVLARESARLSEVTDGTTLAHWRRGVVEELMKPQSPYALALRQTSDVCDQADFFDRWRELIAETVERLPRSGAPKHAPDADRTAVLILAALRGGSTLSQLARDPGPLDAALDLALVPFMTRGDNGLARAGTTNPRSSMDAW